MTRKKAACPEVVVAKEQAEADDAGEALSLTHWRDGSYYVFQATPGIKWLTVWQHMEDGEVRRVDLCDGSLPLLIEWASRAMKGNA